MSRTLDNLNALRKTHEDASRDIMAHIDRLMADLTTEPATPLWRDISAELPTNPGPYKQAALDASGGWWQRTLEQINGVTIHHTLSHSPHATAAHYINKGHGRPTIPYTFWITPTGEILQCVALEQGLWHDHTGHANRHLSVGLAGSLHILPPPKAQLDAAVAVCVWAIETLPGVRGMQDIRGHDAFAATVCPGWKAGNASRDWKTLFYDELGRALE